MPPVPASGVRLIQPTARSWATTAQCPMSVGGSRSQASNSSRRASVAGFTPVLWRITSGSDSMARIMGTSSARRRRSVTLADRVDMGGTERQGQRS